MILFFWEGGIRDLGIEFIPGRGMQGWHNISVGPRLPPHHVSSLVLVACGRWVAGPPILFASDSADKVKYSVLRDDLTFLEGVWQTVVIVR